MNFSDYLPFPLQPWALAICMISVFLLFFIELLASRWGSARLAKAGTTGYGALATLNSELSNGQAYVFLLDYNSNRPPRTRGATIVLNLRPLEDSKAASCSGDWPGPATYALLYVLVLFFRTSHWHLRPRIWDPATQRLDWTDARCD